MRGMTRLPISRAYCLWDAVDDDVGFAVPGLELAGPLSRHEASWEG